MTEAQEEVEQKCIQELKLNEDILRLTIFVHNTPTNDNESGKFYVCVFESRGVMNEDGFIVREKADKFAEDFFFDPVVRPPNKDVFFNELNESCVPIKEATKEETAVKFKNCVVRIVREQTGIN